MITENNICNNNLVVSLLKENASYDDVFFVYSTSVSSSDDPVGLQEI